MNLMQLCRSQVQPALSCTLGNGSDATRVLATTTVEYHSFNAGQLGPLGDELANLVCLGSLVTIEGAHVCFERGCRREREALAVIDDLHEYVTGRTSDDQARTKLGADDLLTKACVPAALCGRLALASSSETHDYLPDFPA